MSSQALGLSGALRGRSWACAVIVMALLSIRSGRWACLCLSPGAATPLPHLAPAALPLPQLLHCDPHARCNEDWQTRVHEQGRCATYGICGHRRDGDPLSCPDNGAARPLNATSAQKLQAVCPQLAADVGPGGGLCCTEEQLDQLQKQVGPNATGLGTSPSPAAAAAASVNWSPAALRHPACGPSSAPQIQIASIFLVGCPACNHNFKHFFCLLTCSPDQAAFANVTAVQPAYDSNATAVAEIDYFVSGGQRPRGVWRARGGQGGGPAARGQRIHLHPDIYCPGSPVHPTCALFALSSWPAISLLRFPVPSQPPLGSGSTTAARMLSTPS